MAEELLLNTMVEFIGVYYDQPIVKEDMDEAK